MERGKKEKPILLPLCFAVLLNSVGVNSVKLSP